MHICPCSWALVICKNIGIRTYFGWVKAKSVGVFRHFGILYKSARTYQFFLLHLRTVFFEAHLLNPWKSGNFERLKVTRFSWKTPIPLSHPICYRCSAQLWQLCFCGGIFWLLGCNNGIGGFHEILVTFWYPKLPDVLWAQKRHLKKMQFLGAINKVASLGNFIQNAKWWKNRTDSAVTEPNSGPNPNILAYSKSSWRGANMHTWVYK